MKWVEFMHSYAFVLKHRSRKSNKVADALSRRSSLLSTMTMEVTRLEGMKDLYEFGLDFVESWKACKDPWRCNKTPYLDYFIQEGFLFKNHQLCIPRGSMRDNLIRELHNGWLSGHFGMDKTKELLEEHYY